MKKLKAACMSDSEKEIGEMEIEEDDYQVNVLNEFVEIGETVGQVNMEEFNVNLMMESKVKMDCRFKWIKI